MLIFKRIGLQIRYNHNICAVENIFHFFQNLLPLPILLNLTQ